jgi:Xaa-Pro aminopeptidase
MQIRPHLLVPVSGVLLAAACAPVGPVATAPAPTAAWTVPSLPPAQAVTAGEFARRRAGLAAELEDGVFVALGASEPEADYLPYSQRSNFYYLTGIREPGAALVIEKSGDSVRETLFVLRRDPAREIWEGTRLGAQGAASLTGITALTSDRLIPTVQDLLQRHNRLYTLVPVPREVPLGGTITGEQQIVLALAGSRPGTELRSVADAVRRLRAAKSPAELDLIRRAAYITNLAHREAARAIRPGMNEFEIRALIESTFMRYGAHHPAFSSIVGSGPNSTTLHYRDADRFMEAQDVVVIDIGASYRGYAADVTRTYPVDGVFSPEQRAIYQIVLDAQKAAERLARPGAPWMALNQAAERVIARGLAELGLIDGADATYRCESPRFGDAAGDCLQIRLFYMHGLGHGIGLDVHDPDLYEYTGQLQMGSAFTIEPGIYVRADALDFLPDTPGNRAMIERLRPAVERYRNIGVRIEDDYIITQTGFERLTEAAPREVDEIETLMRQPSPWNAQRQPHVVEWYRHTTPR